jgi:peptidoglycan/xylan/chitin deacetylase (PgdA/CDA1 family)
MVRRFLGNTRRYILNSLNKPAIVLLYHRVTHLEKDPQLLAVCPDNFYDQIDLLKNNYSLLEIDEFSELFVRQKKMPPNPVIITFDDGYADNFHEALPILESLNSQALFYITTSNLGTPYELWWDELERILLDDHHLPDFAEIKFKKESIKFSLLTATDRLNSYHSLHPYLKYSTPQERSDLIDQLRSSANLTDKGRESHRLMAIDEVRQLGSSRSAIIGAHTHNHPALSVLSYDQQKSEIAQSKLILENIVQKQVTHFSYPYGSKKDYNADSVQISRETGFKIVCSNYYGHVHSWTHPLQIPRILVRDWDKKTFSEHVAKFFRN